MPINFRQNKLKCLNTKFKNTTFKRKINSLWDEAVKKIHPYQRGDTSQSSDHCLRDMEYINNLVEYFDKNNDKEISSLEAYLLICSAILHDLDKAIFKYEERVKSKKKHGAISSQFIIDHPSRFYFSPQVANAVATIIFFHGDRSFGDDEIRLTHKVINDPDYYQKYGKVRLKTLSAIFKLADMMDVTYKRVSDIIIELNFPTGIDDPKIIARMIFEQPQIVGKGISLHTQNNLRNFFEWQSVIVAIDMMNYELEETGAKEVLRHENMPFYFYLGGNKTLYHHPPGDIENMVNIRKNISTFDEEWKLRIEGGLDESTLESTFSINEKNTIRLSKNELEQFRIKYPNQYFIASKKSLEELKTELEKRFFFVIENMSITRDYKEDGTIITSVTYKNILKKPASPLSIRFFSNETSESANMLKKDVSVNYKTVSKTENDYNTVRKNKGKTLIVSLPRFVNLTTIKEVVLQCKATNAWAENRRKYKQFYPGTKEYIESYTLGCREPICQVEMTLRFPHRSSIEPKCHYIFHGTSREINLKTESNNTFTLIDLIQDTNRTYEEYPKYQISWKVGGK